MTVTSSRRYSTFLVLSWCCYWNLGLASAVAGTTRNTHHHHHDDPPKATNRDNMNGQYVLSSTPGAHNTQRLFPKHYRDYPGPMPVESFDVYSPVISTLYSQVFWKGLPPVAMPPHIVEKYAHGKVMAVVGFEIDQVMLTRDNQEVSLPLTAAYNHHFESTMIGGAARMELANPDDPRLQYNNNNHNSDMGHGHPPDQPQWLVVGDDISSTGLPTKQDFGGANGGEFRQSFHGFAPGFAQLIESPHQVQITPMQIDTWHRELMPLPKSNQEAPSTFVPGPLPRQSLAPENATYSGLLECPVTTRLHRVLDHADWEPLQGHDACPSATTTTTAEACFQAVASTLLQGSDDTTSGVTFVNETVSTNRAPYGCSARVIESASSTSTVVRVLFNTPPSSSSSSFSHQNDATPCAGGESSTAEMTMVGTMPSSASTTINLTVAVNGSVDLVTITMNGPADVWFAVGFGAKTMADQPWTIVVDNGQVTERHLQDHNPGTILPSSLTVVSNTVEGTLRTVVVTRPLQGELFTFRTNVTTLPLIHAVGSTPDLSYHHAKDSSTMIFLPVSHKDDDTTNTPGTCFCPTSPARFGNAAGSLEYHPVPGEAGTRGKVPFNNHCDPQPRTDLLAHRNPTCDVRTYVGGQLACHHMWSLLDADQDIPWPDQPLEYRLKFRFWVQPYNATYHRNVYRTTWGIASPVEYDVPKCAKGVPACSQDNEGRWIHTIRGTFAVDQHNAGPLVSAHFHCHAPTCRSVALYLCPTNSNTTDCNEQTGQLLCRETPIVGKGDATNRHRFDEPGFINVPPCLWGSSEFGLEEPVDVRGRTLHAVKTADATHGHHGEMAWLQMYYI